MSFHAVNFARDNGLLVAVRGGGHNIAGNAICDGGVVIDLSQMKDVRVDPGGATSSGRSRRHARRRRQGDASLRTGHPDWHQFHDRNRRLDARRGFGWLTRKYGLTIDSLIAAEVVTADGETRRASATENEDLFWAIRGGGGNFGVVTAFEFKLSPAGPQVYSGLLVHPIADARTVLKAYRQAVAAAPDEVACWTVMRRRQLRSFVRRLV